ncbi:MAG: hypothetical protein GXP09_04330 [Gammaproteobacteria bacterium]|nr:hypothetical protein [Gammaproteobacteria bacterium]
MSIKRTDKFLWVGLFLWAAVSAGLGLYGWAVYELARGNKFDPSLFLKIVARTISFFSAEKPDIPIPDDYYSLLIARVTAPLATAGAILRVGIEFFASTIKARRIRMMKDHTVVCGLSKNGLAFAKSEVDCGHKVVLIGNKYDEANETVARLLGFEILVGNPLDRAILEEAAIHKARRLIVALPDDSENLEVTMMARKIVEERLRVGSRLLASVAVSNRQLWRQLVRSESIKRSCGSFDMLPFNLSVWAVRQFIWAEPLWNYAKLRNQKRIHVVFIGFDDYTEAMIGYLPPASVYPDFECPVFTILTDDEAMAKSRIEQAYPQIKGKEIAEIRFENFRFETDRLSKELMAKIERADEVTAVFICLDQGATALSAAICVQNTMQQTGCWKSPTYVRLSKCEGIGDLLVASSHARRFSDIIQPFGVEDRLCSLKKLEGSLEDIALKIHLAYVGDRQTRLGHEGEGRSGLPLSKWRELSETYRVSNRRAADHIKTKLSAAGYYVSGGYALDVSNGFRFCEDTDTLEMLAELEHRSWVAGRYVDGWQYGERRDDTRKLHPNIVPYESLDEQTRDFDRNQIRLLDRSLLTRVEDGGNQDLIRKDCWIGLIGKNHIDAEEGDWLREQIADILRKLADRNPDVHLTLVTPLAPGSDYVMTKTAVEYLQKHNVPHRLLIIEAVPEARMIEDYKKVFEAGAAWNGEPRIDNTVWRGSGKDNKPLPGLISNARQDIIDGGSTEWVIDLTESSADYYDVKVRKLGYQKASEYIYQRSHTLVAAHRPGREQGNGLAGVGGTEEALLRRAEFLQGAQKNGFTNVILDLDEHLVSEERL